jgi:hypothetical protein
MSERTTASPPPAEPGAATRDPTIRPFHVDIPQVDFDELRRRILATRWPDKETVADRSQGIQLANLQELVRYWGTDYDWRKAEAQLNALPSSSPPSTGSTSTSSTSALATRTPCR